MLLINIFVNNKTIININSCSIIAMYFKNKVMSSWGNSNRIIKSFPLICLNREGRHSITATTDYLYCFSIKIIFKNVIGYISIKSRLKVTIHSGTITGTFFN